MKVVKVLCKSPSLRILRDAGEDKEPRTFRAESVCWAWPVDLRAGRTSKNLLLYYFIIAEARPRQPSDYIHKLKIFFSKICLVYTFLLGNSINASKINILINFFSHTIGTKTCKLIFSALA